MAVIWGMDRLLANLQRIEREINVEVKKAVEESCLDLQGKAQERAPLDTGDLRGSANTKITTTARRIKGEVGFNEPYALEQHENLQYSHPQGGEAKYLENPFKENENTYKQNIEDAVRSVTR